MTRYNEEGMYDARPRPKETPEQFTERMYQKRLAAGEVVIMRHPGKGDRYIDNTPKAIAMAERRGYKPVEMVEKVVVTAGPVKDEVGDAAPEADKPAKPRRGRPRKAKAEE